jgi:hypothetical protein
MKDLTYATKKDVVFTMKSENDTKPSATGTTLGLGGADEVFVTIDFQSRSYEIHFLRNRASSGAPVFMATSWPEELPKPTLSNPVTYWVIKRVFRMLDQ